MEFYKSYCDLKAGIAPFRVHGDYEFVKTVAAIDALSDRAYVIHHGCSPAGRYGWGNTQDFTEEALMDRAYIYLEALERGEFPLAGMFAEPGGGGLSDHCFVKIDDVMHVFYNRAHIGYLWDQHPVDSFGHATSTDLIHWTVHPPVFTKMKGGHDDYQIWSPAIVDYHDEYWMFYTGVNFEIAQATCLAKSKDLIHWSRYSGNPILIPGDWCPWSAGEWSDCRDPMVFKDDDGMFYMYYCSSQRIGEGKIRPVVGAASSCDLVNWKDEGPIAVPGEDRTIESPFMIKHNGKYYLFYTKCGVGTAYATSDNPLSGWKVLPDNKNVLMNTGCSEVFEFQGKWYISLATYLGRMEQYLQIAEFVWHEDGTVSVGRVLK